MLSTQAPHSRHTAPTQVTKSVTPAAPSVDIDPAVTVGVLMTGWVDKECYHFKQPQAETYVKSLCALRSL